MSHGATLLYLLRQMLSLSFLPPPTEDGMEGDGKQREERTASMTRTSPSPLSPLDCAQILSLHPASPLGGLTAPSAQNPTFDGSGSGWTGASLSFCAWTTTALWASLEKKVQKGRSASLAASSPRIRSIRTTEERRTDQDGRRIDL
ncbi:uncharacterized protein LOC101166520 [Oryzias latipes]|uniref:uncharacterized protein LOC101166520 n=1 Tax=Oryzias latipes TaxID=8090 RepID=UPI0009DA79E7|nr:uncharacterized protein LOC101166520 [Oryzias latipes]